MTDAMEMAQDYEQRDRDAAIDAQARKARIAASFAPIDPSVHRHCFDCDKPIPAERLQAVATIRCAGCADAHHRKLLRQQGALRA